MAIYDVASEAQSPSSGERSPHVATLTRISLGPGVPIKCATCIYMYKNSGRGVDVRSDSGCDD